jgi:osmotically-inducible protein OsmY
MTILPAIAAILAALLLLAAAAGGSGPAAAQAAPSLADASITARVERALYNERSLEHAHISVGTRGGIVTLSGFASTIEDIALAGRLAGGIDGVRAITNAIRVANRPTRA